MNIHSPYERDCTKYSGSSVLCWIIGMEPYGFSSDRSLVLNTNKQCKYFDVTVVIKRIIFYNSVKKYVNRVHFKQRESKNHGRSKCYYILSISAMELSLVDLWWESLNETFNLDNVNKGNSKYHRTSFGLDVYGRRIIQHRYTLQV